MEQTTLFQKPDKILDPLYVITPIYNPIRFRSRWKLYERFRKHIEESGALLYTIEAAFGERHHSLTEISSHKVQGQCPVLKEENDANCVHDDPRRGGHRYIRVRTYDELWLKENLINVAIQRLPSDAKYVAWIDADVMFLRPDWVAETIHQLQHYKFLQMFSYAQDLGPNYEVISKRESFMFNYLEGGVLPTGYYSAYQKGGAWSGLAWACRKEAFDEVGGLIDFAIHGGADWSMAFALVGQVDLSMRHDLHPHYTQAMKRWETLCNRHIRRNVGCMSGTVSHFWHGRKKNRRYSDRHKLLSMTQFDPLNDLKKDWQGIFQLEDDGSERFLLLRDGLRKYARDRLEDGNEL